MSVSSLLLTGGRWRCFPALLESSFFQTLHNSCCRKKSTTPTKSIPVVGMCDENPKESEKALDKLFSAKQQASILHVLNTASDKELEAVRLLRGRRSNNIVEHREKFGPFQNLESLMDVPLFQYKTTIQVCNSILFPNAGKQRENQENRVLRNLINPEIGREELKAANSIVSIVFGTRKIAWVHLDRNLAVLDWQQNECCQLIKGKYQSSVYFQKISSIISKIPEADFYVLQKIGISVQNLSLFPALLHFHIIEAMLYTMLNKTFAQDGRHQVLSMNRNAVGRHFELMVGNTRTSGKELVKQFLSDSVLTARPRVFFPPDKIVRYRQMFSSTEQYRIEELYDSLLQAIAFYELIVLDRVPKARCSEDPH